MQTAGLFCRLSLATFGAHSLSQNGTQVSATLGGAQRGVSLNQAATFGAPARAAAVTGLVSAPAAATGAALWRLQAMGMGEGIKGTILSAFRNALIRGISDDAMPAPSAPRIDPAPPPSISAAGPPPPAALPPLTPRP